MAMSYKTKTLWYDQQADSFFDPLRGNIIPSFIGLTRQEIIRLRIQVVTRQDIPLNDNLTFPDAYTVSLLNISTLLFGIKTNANMISGGDYLAVWSGLDQADTSWFQALYGRLSILIAPTSGLAVGRYACEFARVFNGVMDLRMRHDCMIQYQLNLGTEPSIPVGVTSPNSGTATITAPADFVDVSYTGMTASGVVIASLLNTSEPTTLVVTPGTNTFRITAGAVPTTTYTIAYFVGSV